MKRCIAPLLAVAVIGCRVPEGSLAPAQNEATITRAIGVAASTNLFAVVDTHGALVAGRGVTSVTPLGAGAVEVTSTQPVAPCAYVATPTNAYADAIIVSTAGAISPNGIVVTSRTQTGLPMAGAFHLLVSCTAVMPFAVVDVNGQVARSSGGVTTAAAGTGVYRVTFPQNIAGCSYLASLGDAGQVTVPSVGGVYTASYVGVNTVRVETRNASGVSQAGLPFHLVTLCGTASNTAYAVLSAGGLIVRGSPAGAGTVSHSAAGLYTVNSTGNTSGCAKLVTRGSSGRGIPSTAATVEIGAGSSARLFTVEVRALLAQGGSFTDEDFHLGVVC